ncbi:hypothetical protein PPL_00057 [Heterostelium album PN500]|uniref:Uncharacterized protein n=1 Tax=Heterostelium pallidum (strain ATCC 26659 / Pp 5 / PN500) TaxID=670386 RepID=D3BVQ6_HETP5|nr:hypothetical protein PPL_00057 [Heterostelium album PN500]EFA74559.1 hypothetical protein PPL_00057 [Heterostelium album PN500]|eukprot:XP_020426693.1 hypothetical protein PPL_00057 [Heterostelium album PN500]
MNSKFIYIFVLYLFYSIGTSVVQSVECGSNAPPLGNYQFLNPTRYWYADLYYEDSNSSLIDFGAVGRSSHAVPEKIYSYYQSASTRMRFTVNDIYDVYYTFRDYSGAPCNRTVVSNTKTLTIPYTKIVQPLCLYTNATLTPINNTQINTESFTIQSVAPQIPNEMIAFTPTFQYRVKSNGVHSITFLNGYTFLIRLQAQNPLVPSLSFSQGIIGSNGTVAILNYQSFSSAHLYDSEGNEVAPIDPSTMTFPYEDQKVYTLIANSNTCGAQLMTISSNLLPVLRNKIHSSNCQDGTVDVSFYFDNNVTGADYSMYIQNGPRFMVGDILTFQRGASLTIHLSGQFQVAYNFITPNLGTNFTYSIDAIPTCDTPGMIKIQYNGNYSDIVVNNVPMTNMYMTLEYGKEYLVQTCGDPIPIKFQRVPLYSIESTSTDCLGISTIALQNYNLFNEIVIHDSNLNINYTTTDEVIRSTTTCSDAVTVNYLFINHGITIDNVTVDIYPGETQKHQITFGSCPPIQFPLTSSNVKNHTTYKIIQPAVCKDSFMVAELISVDLLDLIYLAINNTTPIGFRNGQIFLPVGKYFIVALYQTKVSRCFSVIDVDIPYSKDYDLQYTVTNQDSTKCNQPTGSIVFSNFSDYHLLAIGEQATSTGAFTQLAVYPDGYSIYFNHTVCGVGLKIIPIVTDGQVNLEEIYRPTCNNGLGRSDGIYRVKGKDRLGNDIQNTSVDSFNSNYYIGGMKLIVNIPTGNYNFKVKSGDYCQWNFIGTAQTSPVNFTFSIDQPFRYQPGSVNFTTNTKIRMESIVAFTSQSSYVYPDYIGSISSDNRGVFLYDYNDYCSAFVDMPKNPPEPDFQIQTITKCGTKDKTLQIPQSIVDQYYISTSIGSLDSNNQIHTLTNVDFYFTLKATGQQYTYSYIYVDTPLSQIPIETSVTSETCIGTRDGSITITNQNPDFTYLLFDVAGESLLPQVLKGRWDSLTSGVYLLATINNTDLTCFTSSENIFVNASSPVITASVINQCTPGKNGTVTFSTTQGGNNMDSIYFVGGAEIGSRNLTLAPGSYTVTGVTTSSSCRQVVSQTFTVLSNIVEAEVTSSICATASIVIRSELQSQLVIRLFNVTNSPLDGNGNLVGQVINGNTASISNLSRGTYQFTVTESSGCYIATPQFNILECPTQPPTETPTQPINQSHQLSPSSSLLSIMTLIILSFLMFN